MSGDASEGAMSGPFRLNEPAVITDVIDGEAMIMNLERGNYYGLDETGSDVWRMIIAGRTLDEVSSQIAGHFSIDPHQVQADVSALLGKMIEQDLLVPIDMPVDSNESFGLEITAGQYSKPELTIYSDMKDLLAFDPPLPTYEPSPKE